MRQVFLFFFVHLIFSSFSQDSLNYIQDEKFIENIERSLKLHFEDWYSRNYSDSIINYNYKEEYIPEFNDSVYISRINKINNLSPFEFIPNDAVLNSIKISAKNRRRFTAICLGRSKLYFPMFEEFLDKYNMPMELKYLSVIESGLRPSAKSRSGACGLWQFMYGTGKIYGLEENNHIDERMNPVLATEAACKYLTYLYSLYSDWSMALAAYNAGPGNVNKAIRRSGGKMTYWEIRPFLPKETQNYVPIFISMTYLMKYHTEHNIKPHEAKFHHFETDTVCISSPLHISTIDSMLLISKKEFKYLNPQFKTDYIPLPKQENKRCIVLPKEKIALFLKTEQLLYANDSIIYQIKGVEDFASKDGLIPKFHIVKKGEKLIDISKKYHISYTTLKLWNGLKSGSDIYVGQKIKLRKPKINVNAVHFSQTNQNSTLNNGSRFYTIKKGDNFWMISKRFNTTTNQLKRLNPTINPKRLKRGQKIKIK